MMPCPWMVMHAWVLVADKQHPVAIKSGVQNSHVVMTALMVGKVMQSA